MPEAVLAFPVRKSPVVCHIRIDKRLFRKTDYAFTCYHLGEWYHDADSGAGYLVHGRILVVQKG